MSAEFEIKDKYTIEDLVSIVKVLRAPGGCPWDRAQTHDSIKKNFIEETYEVVEAINKQDTGGLKEELGDILLQVALHSEMESEKGNFDFNDVANDIVKKLVFRHPHVFGSVQADDVDSALNSWDSAKQVEKSIKSQTDSMLRVPRELPALMRAQKVQHKAAKVGFDWDDVSGAVDKLYEEINELKTAVSDNVKLRTNSAMFCSPVLILHAFWMLTVRRRSPAPPTNLFQDFQLSSSLHGSAELI